MAHERIVAVALEDGEGCRRGRWAKQCLVMVDFSAEPDCLQGGRGRGWTWTWGCRCTRTRTGLTLAPDTHPQGTLTGLRAASA